MADLLASLFVLLCQIYSSVGDCGAFHNEGCNLNFTWCWVLWVQPVCWSFFVGEAGGIIRVPRNWRFFNWIAMFTCLWSWWCSHLSYFTRSVSWAIRMSSLFCLQPQISNLNIHGYVWYCKSYYKHNLVAEGMSSKPEIMCSCNLKLLIHSGQPPLILEPIYSLE